MTDAAPEADTQALGEAGQLWDLVRAICEEINDLEGVSGDQDRAGDPAGAAGSGTDLLGPAAQLQRLLHLHYQSRDRAKVLRVTQIAMMLERNLYLEKLQALHALGSQEAWASPLLSELRRVLQAEQSGGDVTDEGGAGASSSRDATMQ